jgi:hypothetical protein
MASKSNWFSKLFSKAPEAKPVPPSLVKDELASEKKAAETGKDVPVSVRQVIEMEVVFEMRAIEPGEQKWLREQAFSIVKYCWPEFVQSLIETNPQAAFSVQYIEPETAARSAGQKADQLHAHLITQPTAAMLEHPAKGATKYEFSLNLYLRSDPTHPPATVIVAANHRVVPGSENE